MKAMITKLWKYIYIYIFFLSKLILLSTRCFFLIYSKSPSRWVYIIRPWARKHIVQNICPHKNIYEYTSAKPNVVVSILWVEFSCHMFTAFMWYVLCCNKYHEVFEAMAQWLRGHSHYVFVQFLHVVYSINIFFNRYY